MTVHHHARMPRPPAPLPLTLATTVQVMAAYGSAVEHREQHLVLRSPRLPGHAFGDLVIVTDPAAVDEADHWLRVFAEEVPGRPLPALGLPAEPDGLVWAGASSPALAERGMGLRLHRWTALRAGAPRPRRGDDRLAVRECRTDEAWCALAALEGEGEFLTRLRGLKRAAVERGEAAFFVATDEGRAVATAGVVLCRVGDTLVGRMQDVLTHESYRRRGLAGRVIVAAHDWARRQGADSSVIVADPDREAIGVYEGLGYVPAGDAWMVFPCR